MYTSLPILYYRTTVGIFLSPSLWTRSMQIYTPSPRDGWKLLFDNCIAGTTLRFGIGIFDLERREFVVEVVPTLLPLELFSWVVSPPLVIMDCIRSWHVCIATEAFPYVLRRQMYIEIHYLVLSHPLLRALTSVDVFGTQVHPNAMVGSLY